MNTKAQALRDEAQRLEDDSAFKSNERESLDTARRLRAEAARHEADAAESFERCDTDGFVSQWASGLNAQLAREQADIEEAGGVATFFRESLTDLDGNPVAAKLIRGKYGLCWAMLDGEDNFTGEFVSAHPVRESTMERKGYREVKSEFVAPAKAIHWAPPGAKGLGGATSVQVIIVPVERGLKYDGVTGVGDWTEVPE